MKPKKFDILRMTSIRSSLIKHEFKRNILKSIISNYRANEHARVKAHTKTLRLSRRQRISRQHNVCRISGKNRGISKPFALTRHVVKSFAKMGKLTNLQVKSW